jgi:hypothetical protein
MVSNWEVRDPDAPLLRISFRIPQLAFSTRFAGLAFSVFVCCLLFSPSVFSDSLTLRNGDRVTGEIVGLMDAMLQFETSYAGVLKVPAAQIAGLTSGKPVTV